MDVLLTLKSSDWFDLALCPVLTRGFTGLDLLFIQVTGAFYPPKYWGREANLACD